RERCSQRPWHGATRAPSSRCRSWECRRGRWSSLAPVEMAHVGIDAGIDGVALVIVLTAERLHPEVIGVAPPCPGVLLRLPFRHRQCFAVIGLVAAEGDEAFLL